jgi:2-amino-4-hydroxy-6-hydroxymethyldihydropteridine diphosphokinase
VTKAFIALGSNLGDRLAHLLAAVDGLPDVVALSPIYETDPVGGPDQGAYLNCVVELATDLDPRTLLAACHAVEAAADRTRDVRWGPRTLDADVLLVGDTVLDDEELTIPHPRMWERRFVLQPLADLAPELVPPELLDTAVGEVRRFEG